MSVKKFPTQEQFESSIVRYLTDCKTNRELPNVAGMCVSLDIGRTQFYEYAKKYPNTISRIRAHIENAWVNRLGELSPTGAIFYLKNAFRGLYKDRKETDITSGGKPLPLLGGITKESIEK